MKMRSKGYITKIKQCKPRYRDEQDGEQQVLSSLALLRCGVGRGMTVVR